MGLDWDQQLMVAEIEFLKKKKTQEGLFSDCCIAEYIIKMASGQALVIMATKGVLQVSALTSHIQNAGYHNFCSIM